MIRLLYFIMRTWKLPIHLSRGSDRELAYVSPKIETIVSGLPKPISQLSIKEPRSSTDGKLGPDRRRRRSRHSSDDEGELLEDGFVNEDIRVGGPYLCLLPVKRIPMTSTHHGKTNNTKALCQGIVNILNKKKISPSFLQPVGRLSKQNPEKTPVPTMLILAKRGELDETWLQTTREVHAYLLEKGIQDMAVELADPAAFQPLLTSTIKHSDKVFHWWEKVLAEILKFLDPKEVNMVGCHRRGRDTNGADNFPTVVVVVDPKIDKSWKATRERIIAILDSYQLSMVGVEIIKGTVERAAKSQVGLRRSHIQGPAQFGVSLGLEGLAHSSSTFGGFVELKRPDTGVWVTFGLTCYHCVVPPWEKRTDPSESHRECY